MNPHARSLCSLYLNKEFIMIKKYAPLALLIVSFILVPAAAVYAIIICGMVMTVSFASAAWQTRGYRVPSAKRSAPTLRIK